MDEGFIDVELLDEQGENLAGKFIRLPIVSLKHEEMIPIMVTAYRSFLFQMLACKISE